MVTYCFGLFIINRSWCKTCKQIDLIMHKPWIYLVATYNTTISNFDFYLYTQLGSSLGMLNIIISPIYVKINLLILISLLMFNNEEK